MAMIVFVYLCLVLMFSRFGDIKLGQDHELPEYTKLLWFTMLFAADIGIRLMFYDVTEPLNHFLTPPNLLTDNLEMVKQAMILYIVVMLSIKQKQIAMLIIIG
ncbi:hypothetical protein AS144_01840 [Francisella endosymbiont of Amblyomma maculatum]|nr:hypothetical protein AS144_01840 [Francisella endosymbiont of Amblyomma maculatum]